MIAEKYNLTQQNAENLKAFLLHVAEREPHLVWEACAEAMEFIAWQQIERIFVRVLAETQSLN